MIPILFDPNDGIENGFTTNGIGRLSSCSRCEVTESLEMEYELELEYPMTGINYSEIVVGRIIGAIPFQNGKIQGFEIYKITRPIGGLVTVYARHVAHQRLDLTPVREFSAGSIKQAFESGIKANALEPCPFTFTTEFSDNISFVNPLPTSIRSLLIGEDISVQALYGGEFEWDNYTVRHKKNRGSDKGAIIRYGKNLIDVTQETNIEETITGVFPYWKSNEAYARADAPIQSDNAGKFPYHRTEVVDVTSDFPNQPTQAQFTSWARDYIEKNKIGIPVVSLTVSFADLKNTIEYRDLKSVPSINLGDIVTVRFERLGIDEQAEVNRTVWDVLRETYVSVDIGEKKNTLAGRLVETAVVADEAVTPTLMSKSVDRATGMLNSGQRGHFIVGRNEEGWSNEALFLDNENLAKAKNILRINNQGIGFTDGGYSEGNYYQSWTIDGHLTLGGIGNHYGDFMILDEKGIPTVQMDKYGLRLWRVEAIGYLDNGVFYEDGSKTKPITPKEGSVYYELSERKFYIRNGSEYKDVFGIEGLNARMTSDGLGIYNGEIDLKWNGQTGLYFKASDGSTGSSDELQIGDFVVSTAYGRQTLQSSDEATGMSGEPEEEGSYFLWAGWRSDSDFSFAVENHGGNGNDKTIVKGHLVVNGVDILDKIHELEESMDDDSGGSTSGDSGGSEDSGGGSTSGDSGEYHLEDDVHGGG